MLSQRKKATNQHCSAPRDGFVQGTGGLSSGVEEQRLMRRFFKKDRDKQDASQSQKVKNTTVLTRLLGQKIPVGEGAKEEGG